MPDERPLVSIIIPNYNARDFLRECLESFEDREYDPVELIVVDNGSTDGSRAMVREEFENVRLETVPPEHGIGHVNNVGLRAATGDVVCFDFNNDEVIEPGWIARLVAVLENNPGVGIVSGVRLQYENRDRIDSAGIEYKVTGHQRSFSNERYADLPDERLRSVDFVEVPVFRREVLEDVGFLDEDYHFYGEDADFCLRAKQSGYDVVVVRDAITYHRRGATTSFSTTSRYYMERSRLRMFLKLFPASGLLVILPYWCLIRPLPRTALILAGYGVDTSTGLAKQVEERFLHVYMLYASVVWNLRNIGKTFRRRRETSAKTLDVDGRSWN